MLPKESKALSRAKRGSGFSLHRAHRPDYLRAEELHEDKSLIYSDITWLPELGSAFGTLRMVQD